MPEFSHKIQERASSPAFFLARPPDGEWKTFAPKLPGVAAQGLTLYYQMEETENGLIFKQLCYLGELEGAGLAIIDATVEMLQGRAFHLLPSLTFREVESFLRDQNHLPAFPGGTTTVYPYFDFAQQFYHHLKNEVSGQTGSKRSPSLASEYLPKKGTVFNPQAQGSFEELSRDQQYEIAENIADSFIRPGLQRDGGDLDIVHLDGGMLAMSYLGNCSFCNYPLTSTMDYIQEVYRMELGLPRFLVVTEN